MLTSGRSLWVLLTASILAVLRAVPGFEHVKHSARVSDVFYAGDPRHLSPWTRRRTFQTDWARGWKANEIALEPAGTVLPHSSDLSLKPGKMLSLRGGYSPRADHQDQADAYHDSLHEDENDDATEDADKAHDGDDEGDKEEKADEDDDNFVVRRARCGRGGGIDRFGRRLDLFADRVAARFDDLFGHFDSLFGHFDSLFAHTKFLGGGPAFNKTGDWDGSLLGDKDGLGSSMAASIGNLISFTASLSDSLTAVVDNLATQQLMPDVMRNVISPADIGVTYDMIGGLHDAKEALRQCVTYPLKYPHLYSEGIAGDCVKGVLLFGPPGTGKTMLAKAVATEGNATFLSVDAGLIHQKYSNESGAFVRAVFRVARRLTPCVIYIDGIDALLDSSNDSTQRSLITAANRTLMQEWDGVRTTADRIFLIASTNRPDALDQAVLRRLPRRILVDLPDAKAREEILRTIMGNNRMAPDVDFSAIAKRMKGYTGSDIRKICREVKARVAHAEARKLEREGKGKVGLEAPGSHRLRAATNDDFDTAMRKLASL